MLMLLIVEDKAIFRILGTDHLILFDVSFREFRGQDTSFGPEKNMRREWCQYLKSGDKSLIIEK